MRRGTTLLLVVVIALPVWLSFAPSLSASQLPACCRRDGNHHCSAIAEMSQAVTDSGGQAVTSVPQHCPAWRVVASSGAVNFLPPKHTIISGGGLPPVLIEHHAIAFVSSGFSSHTDRGPPVIS